MSRQRESVRIQGMSCGHCISAVERALGGIDGLEVREVGLGTAEVEFDGEKVARADIDQAIDDAGFAVVAHIEG